MLVQTDKRVKLMNQLLVGIRVLKLYAWESAQEAAVLEVRRLELGRLRAAVPYRVGLQVSAPPAAGERRGQSCRGAFFSGSATREGARDPALEARRAVLRDCGTGRAACWGRRAAAQAQHTRSRC